MFEIPDYATCAASSVADVPHCERAVTRVTTIMVIDDRSLELKSTVSCNRHVELVEAALAKRSQFPPITVTKSEFPEFIDDMMGRASAW